MLLMPHLRNIN